MAVPDPTAPFVMHGAREAFAAGITHIEQQIEAIEQAVVGNPGLAFDLAKTLLESTCKAILAEKKVACEGAWDLPKLFKETTAQVRLVPVGLPDARGVSDSLRKTIGGLQTVIQSICELRNSHGFASHGKDPTFRQLDAVQALLVARAADAIVSFIFRMHRDTDSEKPPSVLRYDEHAPFNDWVDEQNGPIRIFDVEFRASEVLFQMEPESYRIYLAEFDERVTGAAAEAEAMREKAP